MAEQIQQLASTVASKLNLGGLTGTTAGAIYIDEKTGSDTTGTGSESTPFATLLAAYQSTSPSPETDAEPFKNATFLVRKVEEDKAEWVEPSASAKKKLIKGIELWRKKEARAAVEGERLAKEKAEAEEREKKRREEAKSVVLVDDASKGEAKKVSE